MTQIIKRAQASKNGEELEGFIIDNLNTRLGIESQLGRIITGQDKDLTNQNETLKLASKLLGREVAEAIRLKTALAEAFNIEEQIKNLRQAAVPEKPFVPVPIQEDILPAMEMISGFTTQMQVDAFKFAFAMETARKTKMPSITKEVSDQASAAADAAGRFAQNLARALVSGQGLEKALLNAAISFGLSLIPGGSLFGGAFAHGGTAPGGGIPSIVGEAGGAPEIIQSASPIRVTPLTTNNNTNNNNANVTLVLPGIRTIDRFTLENEIMPMIGKIIQDGGRF